MITCFYIPIITLKEITISVSRTSDTGLYCLNMSWKLTLPFVTCNEKLGSQLIYLELSKWNEFLFALFSCAFRDNSLIYWFENILFGSVRLFMSSVEDWEFVWVCSLSFSSCNDWRHVGHDVSCSSHERKQLLKMRLIIIYQLITLFIL